MNVSKILLRTAVSLTLIGRMLMPQLSLAEQPANQTFGNSDQITLSAAMEELLQAVRQQDDQSLDQLLCTDILAGAHLYRQEQLGLIAPGETSQRLPSLSAEFRTAVRTYFSDVRYEDGNIEGIDAYEPNLLGDEAEVIDDGQARYTNDATAVLQVRFKDTPLPQSIRAWRLQDRWCLIPLPIDTKREGL